MRILGPASFTIETGTIDDGAGNGDDGQVSVRGFGPELSGACHTDRWNLNRAPGNPALDFEYCCLTANSPNVSVNDLVYRVSLFVLLGVLVARVLKCSGRDGRDVENEQ